VNYNPDIQYRAAILRGKSITEMDNLLPIYASIIGTICPCAAEDFKESFNKEFKRQFPAQTKKTIDNHRTEIAGKLFGMYWEDKDQIIQISPRTIKLINDNDQPAFFKDICGKIQFPSPAQSANTYLQQLKDHISFQPCQFTLSLLGLFGKDCDYLTVDEIAYYVYNSLDVLQGKIDPQIVKKTIIQDRNNKIEKKIKIIKNHSYTWQHINEMLHYMEIANLIEISSSKKIKLNFTESRSINALLSDFKLGQIKFDLNRYDLSSADGRKKMVSDWVSYYARPSILNPSELNTSITSLVSEDELSKEIGSAFVFENDSGSSTLELGNQGEDFVYQYEFNRVSKIYPRLQKHVINKSKIKGIGYDIESVEAVGEIPESKLFIEVKATKRYSPIEINENYFDSVNITRNEWVAANQYKDSYRIYRVYFSKSKVQIFEIKNPISLTNDEKKLAIMPLNYRVDFWSSAGKIIHEA
jgi:hypothetical protein